MNVLFWNVQRKPLDGVVVRLVEEHDVDFLVIIESAGDPDRLLGPLRGVGDYRQIPSQKRFAAYGKFDPSSVDRLQPPVDNRRMDFWHLTLAGHADASILVVHGLDVRNHSPEERRLFFERLTENVRWIESKVGHKRTVILGDLNANPFDAVVTGATGLHAIRMKEVNGYSRRCVLGRSYDFFYNPMWGCFRGSEIPLGSYYFYNYGENELFWHMVDQVVLRPEAIPLFPEEQLRILKSAGPIGLLTDRGIPDQKIGSDHLPVLFRLNLEL